MRDFSKKTLAALARKNIVVLGAYMVPLDGPMPCANGERHYRVDDDGCHRIWNLGRVMEAAKGG